MPNKPEDHPPLTVWVYSFSYKYLGSPEDESGHGGGFMFDCRGLPNPHWDRELRPHHGWELPIIEFMERHPEVEEFHNHCAELVVATARIYAARGYERLMVSFGCTGGKHRSVYQAERMRQRLESEGIKVVLTHYQRDQDGQNNGLSEHGA